MCKHKIYDLNLSALESVDSWGVSDLAISLGFFLLSRAYKYIVVWKLKTRHQFFGIGNCK